MFSIRNIINVRKSRNWEQKTSIVEKFTVSFLLYHNLVLYNSREMSRCQLILYAFTSLV
jgi:hypothetical protein